MTPRTSAAIAGCLLVVLLAVAPSAARAESAAGHYEQALIAYNLGEVRTAHIHLKNALQQDPDLLPAHLLLAKLHLALGQGADAEAAIRVAGGLGAHRSLTLVPLARAYLQQGRADRLIGEIFPLGTIPEEDAEILSLRGEAHLLLGDAYEAERAFDQAWQRAPRSLPASLGRAQARMLRGALADALEDAARAVELDPDSAQAWYLKGLIERDSGDTEAALGDFERAVHAEPAHLPAQIARVGVLMDTGRSGEAAVVLGRVRDTYPRDPRTLYLEAVVANARGAHETADRALRDADALIRQLSPQLVDEHAPTLLLAGMVAFSLKHWEQAAGYLERYVRRYPEEVGPRKLLAQILLDRDRHEAAIGMLESARLKAPGDTTLMSLLAEGYTREGRYLKAAQMIEDAITAGADDTRVRTQQAVSGFLLGRKSQAVDQLGAIFASWPDLDSAGSTLVVMLMQKREYAEAARIADQVVARHPDNVTHVNLRGAAYFARGDAATARASFERALEFDGRFVPARLNLAKVDLADGRAAEAQVRLEALLAELPEHAAAMLELARAHEAQGRPDEAVRWARRALEADADGVPVVVYLADLLLRDGKPDDALKVVEEMEVRHPDDARVLEALSRTLLAADRRSTAQVVLQRTSGIAGYDAPLLMRIAGMQQEAGDLDGAVWSLQKAVEAQGDFVPARIRLGEFLAALGRVEKAELTARELVRDFPQKPYGHHLHGLIQQGQGKPGAALASFRAALALEPAPVLAIRVYEMQRLVEGAEAASAFIQEWQAAHPDDRLIRQTVADDHFHAGRCEAARDLYRELLAASPDDALLLNNLALSLHRLGDPQAVGHARRAFELEPASPAIGDTLGWILVRQGRLAEGLRYLRDAQSRAVTDPAIAYHIAVALSEMDRREEAVSELRRLMRSPAEFPERSDAQALLQRLSGAQAKDSARPDG